jgi:hypothetical protein
MTLINWQIKKLVEMKRETVVLEHVTDKTQSRTYLTFFRILVLAELVPTIMDDLILVLDLDCLSVLAY